MALLDTPTLEAPTFTPPVYAPAQSTAQQATPHSYTPETFKVTPEQTQEERIKNIIAADSPLMQQAATRARMAANARGLLNSSMAVQAGQEAVIGAAAPIAEHDAGVFERAGTNTVNAKNAALNFAAQAANQAEIANAQLGTQASMSNADARNKAFSEAYQASLQGSLANLDVASRTGIANLDANTRLSLGQLDAQTRTFLGQLDADTRMGTAQLDAQTRLSLGQLDATVRNQIATMDNQYRQLLQTNQGAASMFNQVTTNITNIQNNQQMSEEAKRTAIQSQLNMLNEALKQQGAVAGADAAVIRNLNLGQFFSPGTTTVGTGGAVTPPPINKPKVPGTTPQPGTTPPPGSVPTQVPRGGYLDPNYNWQWNGKVFVNTGRRTGR